MLELWHTLFAHGPYIPRGHCYSWHRGLVSLHVVSDACIALVCACVPAFLLTSIRHAPFKALRHALPLLIGFVMVSSASHMVDILTLWQPWHWTSGILKAATAGLAMAAAITCVRVRDVASRIDGDVTASNNTRANLEALVREKDALLEAAQRSTADDAYRSQIIATMPQPVVVLSASGRIQIANLAMQRLMCWDSTPLGEFFADIVRLERPARAAAWHSPDVRDLFVGSLGSQASVPVEVRTALIRGPSGTGLGTVMTLHDLRGVRRGT